MKNFNPWEGSTLELLHILFSPHPAEEGERGSSWVGTWQQDEINPLHPSAFFFSLQC